MQEKLIALRVPATLAALATALAGPVFAQSSVTLFGAVDTNIVHGSGSISSKTQLGSAEYLSPKLGFKGTEDLGGGLKAGFWLEAGLSPDTGAGAATNTNNQASGAALPGLAGGQGLTFNRRSHVSLGGDWGEIRVGREYTPQFWNQDDFDPFSTGLIGGNQVLNSAITGVTTIRASNGISYLYGHGFNASSIGYGPDGFSGTGFQLQATHYLGENPSGTATSKDGTGDGIRAVYSGGRFTVSAAVSRTKYAAGNVRQNNVGANYDFGVANLMGMYESDKNGAISAKGYLVGTKVPVGPGIIKVAYSHYRTDAATNPTAKKLAVGYQYNLSKRTALYTTYAHVKNKGTSASALGGAVTAAGGSSSGFDIGIAHSF